MLQILIPSPQFADALILDFLEEQPARDIPDLIFTPSFERPNYYPIRILVIGVPPGVNYVVNDLNSRGFSELREWSRPIRARHPGEIIRVMTRDFMMNG